MKPSRQIPATHGRAAGEAAFTLVEIAISLAIIGFALVAIIGALPRGMNVQRENREDTIINQDAAYLVEAIRSGARGLDTLTNSVYAITNYWAFYETNAASTNLNGAPGHDGYTYLRSHITSKSPPPADDTIPINNGYRIIGLLGTPKYIPGSGRSGAGFYSNHVVASVRALSGLAAEKFPQDNPDVRQDAFSYRLITENLLLPVPADFNAISPRRELSGNLHEVRLLFRWPLFPSGTIGNGFQTYRTMVSGTLTNEPLGGVTWFFQAQTFSKAP